MSVIHIQSNSGYTENRVNTFYPPTSEQGISYNAGGLIDKDYINPNYGIQITYWRFDTSSLGAGAVVSAVNFRWSISAPNNVDSRNLLLRWQTPGGWPPTDPGDWVDPVTANAATQAISGLSTGENTIALSNVSNVNRTGYTYILGGISAGQPTGRNEVFSGTGPSTTPYLDITYTTGYAEKVMGIAGSSLTDINGVASASAAKVDGIA